LSRSAHFVRHKTKQKSIPTNTFSGLKIAAKYVCGRGSAQDSTGEAYSAPPDPIAAFGERRRGRGGREREDKKGEEREQGRAGKRRGGNKWRRQEREEGRGPTFGVKFTPL